MNGAAILSLGFLCFWQLSLPGLGAPNSMASRSCSTAYADKQVRREAAASRIEHQLQAFVVFRIGKVCAPYVL
jgi:hypothetical protein